MKDKNFFYLMISSQLHTIGGTFLSVFGLVFILKEYNYSIPNTITFYLIYFLLYLILLPLFGKVFNLIGLKKTIIIGKLFLISTYFSYLIFDPTNYWTVILTFITGVLGTGLYWIPYNTELAVLSDKKKVGSQMGSMHAIAVIIGIIVPSVSGILLSNFGFNILYIATAICYSISIIFLSKIEYSKEHFDLNYFGVYKEIFDKKFIKDYFVYFLQGIEYTISSIIWPLLIFFIFNGNYENIGYSMSVIFLFSLILSFFFGKLSDKIKKEKLVKFGSFLYSFGWVIKMIFNYGHLFFISSAYHDLSRIIMQVPLDSYFCEKASSNDHFADEYTVTREVSMMIGRIMGFIILLILIMSFKIDIKYTLLIGAFIYLIIGMVVNRKEIITQTKN